MARGHLARERAARGLAETDLEDLFVHSRHALSDGSLVRLYFRQRLEGIEVKGGDLALGVTREGRVVGLEDRLVRRLRTVPRPRVPALSAEQAVRRAAIHLGLPAGAIQVTEQRGGPEREARLVASGVSRDPIPAKLAYHRGPGASLRLAWELLVRPPGRAEAWDLSVDATTGAVIAQHDRVDHDSYRVYPLPLRSPDQGYEPQLELSPADPVSSPFGWHDQDGSPGAEFTDTRGNHVHAQEDADDSDGGGGDDGDGGEDGFRPDGGPSLLFDFAFDPNLPPAAQQAASVTQLFYMTSWLHDIHLRYGFDEQSGNFQTLNYSGQGLGGDPVRADAQDGQGINNANFETPPDGEPARLQAYLFHNGKVVIHSPPEIAGTYPAGSAQFNPPMSTSVTGAVVAALDQGGVSATDGCDPLVSPVTGAVALVDRGNCGYALKAVNAEAAGAVGLIVVNYAGQFNTLNMTGQFPGLTVTSAFLGNNLGTAIRDALLGGPVSVTVSDVLRDSSVDAELVVHEYGHGVSRRLTGGAAQVACLDHLQSKGMGEGWSDFWALALTVFPDETRLTARTFAAYSAGDPDGPGLRNLPYTTDLAVNGQTLANVASTNWPHGVGEVWALALWEAFWNLVDLLGMDYDLPAGTGGNNVMLQLVMDGLKLQPCNPTFLQARDAILLADVQTNTGANRCRLWSGFAKRGLGVSAAVGPSTSLVVSQAFDVPPDCVSDFDQDGWPDGGDNCATTPNAGQADQGGVETASRDWIGDACQCGEAEGNGIVDQADLTFLRQALAAQVVLTPEQESACASRSLSGQCDEAALTRLRRGLQGLPPGLGQTCAAALPVP
jgi:hypothetical protein